MHFIDNLGGNLGSFDRIEKSLADGARWSEFDRGISSSAYFCTRASRARSGLGAGRLVAYRPDLMSCGDVKWTRWCRSPGRGCCQPLRSFAFSASDYDAMHGWHRARAGASKRLGRPKQTLPFGDTTLLGHVLRDVEDSTLDRVVLVVGGAAGTRLPLSSPDAPRWFETTLTGAAAHRPCSQASTLRATRRL